MKTILATLVLAVLPAGAGKMFSLSTLFPDRGLDFGNSPHAAAVANSITSAFAFLKGVSQEYRSICPKREPIWETSRLCFLTLSRQKSSPKPRSVNKAMSYQ